MVHIRFIDSSRATVPLSILHHLKPGDRISYVPPRVIPTAHRIHRNEIMSMLGKTINYNGIQGDIHGIREVNGEALIVLCTSNGLHHRARLSNIARVEPKIAEPPVHSIILSDFDEQASQLSNHTPKSKASSKQSKRSSKLGDVSKSTKSSKSSRSSKTSKSCSVRSSKSTLSSSSSANLLRQQNELLASIIQQNCAKDEEIKN